MEKIVFTNGCFDLLHPGHVDLLERARELGTRLIVGINSDESVRAIKGAPRPFCTEEDRKSVLLGLRAVDEVRIFRETTPERLIREIAPDVLVKGGDWQIGEIVGADFVLKNGGEVYSLALKEGFSTSKVAEKIIRSSGEKDSGKLEIEAIGKAVDSSGTEIYLRRIAGIFEKLRAGDLRQIEKCSEIVFENRRRGKKIFFAGDRANADFVECLAARWNSESFNPENDSSAEGLLIALSETGVSPEILDASISARRSKKITIALTGSGGKKLAALCDAAVLIGSQSAAEIRAAQAALTEFWFAAEAKNSTSEK